MGIFLVLAFCLNFLLFKPMLRVIEERRSRTEGRRKAAAQAETEAEGVWENYQKKIAEARAAGDAARMEMVRKGEAERQRITEKAAEESEKTHSEIRARVRADAESARGAIRGQVDGLARVMAEKVLGRAV
jgi:F-type H+-transporting ATPase subunit b